jgi:hypothetical protein
MEKREMDFFQSQISSSLPPSILRPDYPKAVRVTPKEESGSNTGVTPENQDDTPSSEVTIKGIPIVYEPDLGIPDDTAIMLSPEGKPLGILKMNSRFPSYDGPGLQNPATAPDAVPVKDEDDGEEAT